jgi:hypothetical protein
VEANDLARLFDQEIGYDLFERVVGGKKIFSQTVECLA